MFPWLQDKENTSQNTQKREISSEKYTPKNDQVKQQKKPNYHDRNKGQFSDQDQFKVGSELFNDLHFNPYYDNTFDNNSPKSSQKDDYYDRKAQKHNDRYQDSVEESPDGSQERKQQRKRQKTPKNLQKRYSENLDQSHLKSYQSHQNIKSYNNNKITSNNKSLHVDHSQPSFHKSHLHNHQYETVKSGTLDNSSKKYPKNYATVLQEQIEEKNRLKKREQQEDRERTKKAMYEQAQLYGKETGGGAPIYDLQGKPITKIKGITQNHLVDYEKTKLFKQTLKDRKNIWNEEDKSMMDKMFEKQDQSKQVYLQRNKQFYDRIENDIKRKEDPEDYDKGGWDEEDKDMFQIMEERDKQERALQEKHRRDYFDTIAAQVEEKKQKKKAQKQQELYESLKEDERIRKDLQEMADQYKTEQYKKERLIETQKSKMMQKKKEKKYQTNQEQEKQFFEETKITNSRVIKTPPKVIDYNDIQEKQTPSQQQQAPQSREVDSEFQQEQGRNPLQIQTQEFQQYGTAGAQQQQNNNKQYVGQQQMYQTPSVQFQSQYPQQQQQYQSSNYNSNPSMYQGIIQQTAGGTEQFFRQLDGQEMLYKQKRELDNLNESLQNQTSILQNEIRELKKDAIYAQEKKREAYQDLAALKEELQRQQIVEQVRFKELQHNMNQQQFVGPYDYLVKENVLNQQAQQSQFIPFTNNASNILKPSNRSIYQQPQNSNNSYLQQQQQQQFADPKKDILDSLVESAVYTPANYGPNNQQQQQPQTQLPNQSIQNNPSNLQYRVEKEIAETNPSLLDNNLQQIDNILLSLKD